MALLAAGLLFPGGPASPQQIQRSTDEKGTIQIVNPTDPAAKGKPENSGLPPDIIIDEPVMPEPGTETEVPQPIQRRSLSEIEARRRAILGDAYTPRRVPMRRSQAGN